jgi:UrcA family protein
MLRPSLCWCLRRRRVKKPLSIPTNEGSLAMLKLMIPAALLAALVPNAAPAQEEGHAEIHIAYRDLDLRSPAGVKQLDRRIEHAIEAVCPDPDATDLARKFAVARCREAKRADVADQRAKVLRSARRDTELAATRLAR